jgi:hypothetical protein
MFRTHFSCDMTTRNTPSLLRKVVSCSPYFTARAYRCLSCLSNMWTHALSSTRYLLIWRSWEMICLGSPMLWIAVLCTLSLSTPSPPHLIFSRTPSSQNLYGIKHRSCVSSPWVAGLLRFPRIYWLNTVLSGVGLSVLFCCAVQFKISSRLTSVQLTRAIINWFGRKGLLCLRYSGPTSNGLGGSWELVSL